MGVFVYGQTVAAEYPGIKRVRNIPGEAFRSENHHPAIIDRASFDRVQGMKRSRTNTEVDDQGNKVRKSTHYSMKRSLDMIGVSIESGKA